MRVHYNRIKGAQFESLLICRAGASGMKALRNELSFRYQRGGKIRPIRADLDFRVLRKDGRIAYVDTKSFNALSFTYSQIDHHQLRRALCYQEYNVPAGFVVWLEPLRQVVFYSGRTLWNHGARTRFGPKHGILLGDSYTFSLAGVFPKDDVGAGSNA